MILLYSHCFLISFNECSDKVLLSNTIQSQKDLCVFLTNRSSEYKRKLTIQAVKIYDPAKQTFKRSSTKLFKQIFDINTELMQLLNL